MSLVYCPECGHEISTNAIACPSCGRPIASIPIIEKKVIVAPSVPSRSGFPNWAFIPIGVFGAILLFILYIGMTSADDSTSTNINVSAARRTSPDPVRETRTTNIPSTESQTVTLPPGQTTTVPGTTTAAPVVPPPDKGTVVINARVAPRSGTPQAARRIKFYLLDKDLEAILGDSRVEPIEGNDLMSSLGLATVYPDRYGDFLRSAMRAVGAHSKYSGTTDSAGNANLQGILPKEYYLFGITKIGRGFALWSAPISVVAGQNNLDLSPQSVTEIPDPTG